MAYEEQDIECHWRSTPHAVEDRYNEDTTDGHATEEPDEDVNIEDHLQNLLAAAEKRATRSSGTKLKWNPKTGDKNVIVKE